jgi:hypothetical protein
VLYIPVAVFLLWGLYGLRKIPRIYDPVVLTRPDNRFWTPFRLLNGAEWTEYGRTIRWRWFKHVLVGAAVAMASMALATILDSRF